MYATILTSLLLSLVVAQTGFNAAPPVNSSKTPAQNISRISREGSVMTGNVAIRRAANGNIVVIVDGSSNAAKTLPDGIPDFVYRFAPLKEDLLRYGNISLNLISLNLRRAQVFFQSGRLAVLTKDDQVILSLSIEKIEDTDTKFQIYGDRTRDLPNTVRLHQGIGLVSQVPIIDNLNRFIDSRKTPKAAKLAALIDLEEDFVIRRSTSASGDNEFEVAGCTAGGVGASSCSIDCAGGTGCGITCGAGFWACCKCPNNCHCSEK